MCLCWNRISLGAAMPACLSSWPVPDFICESGLVLCTSLLMWVDLNCATMAAVGLWKQSAVGLSTGGNLFCFLPKKKKKVFLSSSADWVSTLRAQNEEEFLRCQGPLQIPSQLPGMLVDTDNIRSQQNDTHKIVVVKMSCVLKLRNYRTTESPDNPTSIATYASTWTKSLWYLTVSSHTLTHPHTLTHTWRHNVFCLT